MARVDENGVTIAAPLHFNNPKSASIPRLDDEHRGLSVLDAYELSRCTIDLREILLCYPLPDRIPTDLAKKVESYPAEKRVEWLKVQLGLGEATRRISSAMRTGELPIWIASWDGPERLVAPSAMVEVNEATVTSGCYLPEYDRSKLYGHPLFVKKMDWVKFAARVRLEIGKQRRRSVGYVVGWCVNWIRAGNGNGMDVAWKAFSANPGHKGLSRDDVFRPAWIEAKSKCVLHR